MARCRWGVSQERRSRLKRSALDSRGNSVAIKDLWAVGLDSQCFSYLLDALEGVSEPTDALADERKALVRTYFYSPGTFSLLPQVRAECDRITTRGRHP